MHELSIAETMLQRIAETLGGPRRLLAATATIGPLSGVCAESLRFAFTEVADAMGFGRPELRVQETRVKARCEACHTDYEMKDALAACPQCRSICRKLEGGDELFLDSVELEEDDA